MDPKMHGQETASPRREIATLAYFLWQNAGEPEGTADRDWLLAEHVIATGALKNDSQPKE